MAKGSPKKSPKDSPGKKSNKSDKKEDKKGSKKSIKIDEADKVEKPVQIRKCQGTDSWQQSRFTNYRCPTCFLVLDSFQQFMHHECWRKYYLGQFHLGETQAFHCKTCDRVFQTQIAYGQHTCDQFTAEDVLAISYRDHFKYFMYWDRRIQQDSIEYDTNWPYTCRCTKCGNKFKRDVLYILHSCFLYSLLKPIEVQCLKICRHCKFVFVSENQFNLHLSYCPRQDRAFSYEFINTPFLRTCQQFVLGRYCYDFNLQITQKPLEESDITKKGIAVGCNPCGLVHDSILEYLYHPCVVGKLIEPADIEMIVLCNQCRCLFLSYESCQKHITYCATTYFTFVRLNVAELSVALERWTRDTLKNPYLPRRPQRMKCYSCLEVFCDLTSFLKHDCPKNRRFERILIPPASLAEMYVCESCSFLFFTSTEAVNHAENCASKSLMINIHPNLSEAITALEVWSKLPRLLQIETILGRAGMTEKCPRPSVGEISHKFDECVNVCI